MAQSVPVPPGFDDLSVEQQLDYVHALWQRIAANTEAVPVPEWHREELDRRLAEPSVRSRPWPETRANLVAKYKLSE